jgi:hypothetical protein
VIGTVTAFDDHVGLGTVRLDSAAAWESAGELSFHCTSIADGTRTVPVGTHVSLVVVPGRMGRYEAADVRSV